MSDLRDELAGRIAREYVLVSVLDPHARPAPDSLADAILASGLLDRIRAEAWDQGWNARGWGNPPRLHDGEPGAANPYRTEGGGQG